MTKEEQDSEKSQRKRNLQSILVTTIAVVAFFVFLSVVSEEESLLSFSKGDNVRTGEGHGHAHISEKAHKLCSNVCDLRRQKRFAGVNLLDRSTLIDQASKAKKQLLKKLKKVYGKYFEPIFVDEETGAYRPILPSKDVSMDRLKRKLMIKVLSMQSAFKSKDSDFNGCDCLQNMARRNSVLESLDVEDDSVVFEGIDGEMDAFYEKYVWATGGHSAAAGHGNLYNESYTAYMETDLKDVFASIGIEFEGRNYAMGGTASATIISMCHKEVFGEDLDFFSWDYGMTDGNRVARLFQYVYRGAISPTRPAVMLINYASGRNAAGRYNAAQLLEELGLPLFHMDRDMEAAMRESFPDSAGISDEEIDALPEYVRNYKCGTSIEKGDPFCSKEKYTKWGCSPRQKQTSWHPGFKDHAKSGHGIALFIAEALLSALQDLSEIEEEDIGLLLTQLIKEDIELHNNFTNAELPEIHLKTLDLKGVEVEDDEQAIDHALFLKGRSMCHTARLPSQTRFLGALTDTRQVGGPVPAGEETYFVGYEESIAQKTASKNHEMRIVYKEKERERKCKGVTCKPDYPDSFYVNSLDGWAKLKMPNDAEKRIYRYVPSEHRGIFVFHLKKCDWGKCPKDFLTVDHFAEGRWEMKINNKTVVQAIPIDEFGTIAKGENGFHFLPDENGQYEIQIKVKEEKKYLEFASFVLF